MNLPDLPQPRLAHGALLICAILLLSACGNDRDRSPAPPKIPAYSERVSYEALIAEIDRADTIADPIRKCLDHPNLPNAPWPPALVEALCRDEFTNVPQADFLRRLIEKKDWNGLHAYYARQLSDHRSGKAPEYVLYRAFLVNSWSNLDEAQTYLRQWVSARPDDPFANTALAKVLVWQAYREQSGPPRMGRIGRAISAATNPSSRMNEEAIALAKRAIAKEPDLIPAYDLLMKAHMAEDQPKAMWRALEAAKRRSPAAFFPRSTAIDFFDRYSGGRPEELKALVEDTAKHLRDNPRLGMILSYPIMLEARAHTQADRHGAALERWRQVLTYGPYFEALINGGYEASKLGRDVEGLMYYSQYVRFDKDSTDALSRRGWMWDRNGYSKRALRDYHAALKINPRNVQVQRRIAEAERKAETR